MDRINQQYFHDQKVIEVQVDVLFIHEGDYIVAYCPSLELSAYAKRMTTAKKKFDEVLKIFFEDVHKKGTLEKVLLQLGWTLRQIPDISYKPPQVSINDILSLAQKSKTKSITENISIPI